MATSTGEGSIAPVLQALPAETATGSMLTITASASALAKRRLAVLVSRRVTSPFWLTPGSLACTAATSRSRMISTRVLFAGALGGGDTCGDSEPYDAGHVQRARPQSPFVASAADHWCQPTQCRGRAH